MAGTPDWTSWIAQNESGAAGYRAKNPVSTATGKHQMLEGFYKSLLRKYRPELINKYGSENGAWAAHASDPTMQDEFQQLGNQDNAATAKNAGVNYDQGLFWRLGAPDAMKVMSADPNTPLDRILSPRVIKDNKDLWGRSAGDIVNTHGYPNAKPQGQISSPVPEGFNANNPIKPGTPMQMAMNGGIPTGAEQFKMATPMQTAMGNGEMVDLGNGPKFGAVGADQNTTIENHQPYDLGKRLMLAGAGLSGITNPQGAAAAVAAARTFQDEGMSAYEKEILNLKKEEAAKEAKKENDAANKDQVGAEKRVVTALDAMNAQKALAAEIRQDPSLNRVTGINGLFPSWPGGKAEALQGKIDQLKAQGIFQILKNIKDQSPTGSALGQVSNYENAKMEQAFAPLKQSIGTKDFQANLARYEAQSEKSMAAIKAEYEKTYGIPLPGYEMTAPQTGDPVEEQPLSKVLKVY